MDSNSWKNIIDGLDEDIVDAAAERFSSAENSGDIGEFANDGKTVEYRYPAERKKHRGLYIGIGSAAAAAVVAGIVVLNNSGLILSAQPMVAAGDSPEQSSSTEQSTTVESVSTTPFVVLMEKSAPEVQTGLTSIETDGIDFDLFEEYFYGIWENPDDAEDSIELSYGSNPIFGVQYGYTCLGTILKDDGCYMIVPGGGQYDIWFVPENDRARMFISRDVQILDGQVVYENAEIKCAYTSEYEFDTGNIEEDGSLGYFGQEKLAQKMGLTTDELFEAPELSESTSAYPEDGSTAQHWQRTAALSGSDIWLVSQSTDMVVLTELLEDTSSGATAFFDITWTYNGEWQTTGYAVSDMLKLNCTMLPMGENEFLTFEDIFAGTWLNKSTGDEIMLSYGTYDGDPFQPGDMISINRSNNGVALYHMSAAETTVYYIPDDEPDMMYEYSVTGKNGNTVRRSDYKAVYVRQSGEFAPVDDEAAVNLGVLGINKYMLDNPDLGEVISQILEIDTDGWSNSFFKPGVSVFDGYSIYDNYDGSYTFTYQEFQQDTGESRTVIYNIRNTVKGWESERTELNTAVAVMEESDGGQSDN